MSSERLKLEDLINQAKQTLEGGNPDRAILYCRHIFKYYPRCLEATRVMGEAYTEKGLLEEADQLFTFVLAADPQDVLGYVDRGFIACERTQFEDAIIYYERALELDPNIEQLRLELLRLYREQYGAGRAKLRLTRASLGNHRLRDGFYNQAIEEFNSILRETPNRLDIQVGLMEAHWRNKEYPRAERLALDLLEGHPYLIKANLVLWHIYGVRRRLDKAATYLDTARALDPLNLVAERLFDDPANDDNAWNYLAMVETAIVPQPNLEKLENEAATAALLPRWVTADPFTDRELGLKAIEPEPEPEPAMETAAPISVTDEDWLQRLLQESEAEGEIPVAETAAANEAQGLAQLEELRQDDNIDSLDSLFQEIPQTPVAMEQSGAGEIPGQESFNFEGLEAFDFDFENIPATGQSNLGAFAGFDPANLGEEKPVAGFDLSSLGEEESLPEYNPAILDEAGPIEEFNPENLGEKEAFAGFDLSSLGEEEPFAAFNPAELGEEAETGQPQPVMPVDFENLNFENLNIEIPAMRVEDAPTFNPAAYSESGPELFDFLNDAEAEIEALKIAEPAEQSAPPFEPGEEVFPFAESAWAATPEATAPMVGELDDDSFLNALLENEPDRGDYDFSQDLLDEVEQAEQPAAIPFATLATGLAGEHEFHKRDERGPIPDFIARELATSVEEPVDIAEGDFEDWGHLEDLLAEEEAVTEAAVPEIVPEVVQAEPESTVEAEPEPLPELFEARSGEPGLEDQPLQAAETPPEAKEIEDMPIKRGRQEEENIFDWENEELPDYLQAFAMDENEVEKHGLNVANPPIADVSTSPARIRPRDDTGGGIPSDLPDWLNPSATGRMPVMPPNGEPSNLGNNPRKSTTGDLPNWLDKTLEGQAQSTSGFKIPGLDDDLGLDDLKPFSPDEGDAFGGPAMPTTPTAPQFRPPAQPPFQAPPASPFGNVQPFSPTEMAFSEPPPSMEGDLKPFSFDDVGEGGFDFGGPPAAQQMPADSRPTKPFQPPTPAFGEDLGGIEPFNPFEESQPSFAPPAMPGGFQPPAQFTPPQFTPPAQFTPPPMPQMPAQPPVGGDFGDLQPFSFDFNQPPAAQPGPSSSSTPAPFNPAFDNDEFGLGDLQPFSLDESGAFPPPAQFTPPAQQFTPPMPQVPGFPPQQSPFGSFNQPEQPASFQPGPQDGGDFPDLEPFSMDNWEIPGIASGPGSTRPDPMAYEPEPFFPSPSRRPREVEPEMPLEPGQEKPLRKFSWLEKRREQAANPSKKEKASDLESDTPFARMARKRQELAGKQPEMFESAEVEAALPVEEEKYEDFLTFEEVERQAAMLENEPTAAPVEIPQVHIEESNMGLELGLTDEGFDQLFEESLSGAPHAQPAEVPEQKQPESIEAPAFDLSHLGIEPFDLSELAGEKPAATFEPEIPAFEPVAEQEIPPFELPVEEPFRFEESAAFEFTETIAEPVAEQEIPPFELSVEEPFQFEEPEAFEFSETVAETAEPAFNFDQFNVPPDQFQPVETEAEPEIEPFNFELPQIDEITQSNQLPAFGSDLDFFAASNMATAPETSTPVEPEPEQVPSGLMSFEEAARAFGINLGPEEAATPVEPAPPIAPESLRLFEPEVPSTRPEEDILILGGDEIAQPEMEAAEPYVEPQPVIQQPEPEPAKVVEAAQPVEEKPTQPAAGDQDLAQYQKKATENPRDPTANYALGNAYFDRQDYAQALNYFAATIRTADKDTIGNIVNKLQNIADDQATNPRYHRVLGDAYMKQGQYHWALSEYSKALDKGGKK